MTVLPFRAAARQAEAGRMIGCHFANSAIVVACWDNGGAHLVGLMVMRRSDGHACFVELRPELERRLATLDRQFVEDKAAKRLNIARSRLTACEFEVDQVIS